MELRQLRYFVAVAEELHFGRAAERLHMAQSPLSRQIQGLERELRTLLFRRTTRSVSLTPAGAELLERGRKLLAQADETVLALRGFPGVVAPIRMGFTACAANAVLGRVLRIVRGETGELPVDLRTDLLTPTQLDAITSGRIDVGFVVRSEAPVPEELVVRTVRVEPLAVVLPIGHRLGGDDPIGLLDLADEDVVAFPRHSGSAMRAVLDRACADRSIGLRVVHEARATGTLLGLVAAGVGCAVLPLSIRDGAAAGVTVRPLADPIEVDIAMVWRRDESRPAVLRVVDVVREDFGQVRREPAGCPVDTDCRALSPGSCQHDEHARLRRAVRQPTSRVVAVTRRTRGHLARAIAVTTPQT